MAGGRSQGSISLKTVFLIDGDFFLRRLRKLRGLLDADQVVVALHELCSLHLTALSRDASFLYRVFFYDCPPLDKQIHQPVSKVSLHLGKSASYRFRTALHERLKMTDNVALRLGTLSD
jgi:hypothetical protein